ncbi:LysR family transcriptional regulator [Sphingomonas crocodyli]|uniref:LysR family transcriptional regulator n=1 Tax=Sphingomonas crocodyli TaxID=1979270 RepID=A0A437MAG0_9SPHN|nr:LysR family transcriptional regulator [Sphingomonas crocodyli]RVT94616.1 LysR family transcriptional regulator [Sphingomonas crocodyli]
MIDPDAEVFVEVVKAGSLAAAARALGLSAPLVSRRLSRLEARLGVALAHRTTRRFELTSIGEAYYRDMTVVLDAWQTAETRAKQPARIASGPLRISAPTSFGRLYIAPALKGFLDAHPHVAITLDLTDAYVDLTAMRFDLAIRITATPDPHAVRLAANTRVLCATPGYLDRHGEPASIADLADHRILAAEGQLPWRFAEGDVSGPSYVTTNSSEVVRELALSGMGIALRSLWDVHAELASGALRRILPALSTASDAGIYAVRPRAEGSTAATRAFIDYLRDLLSPVAPWETP